MAISEERKGELYVLSHNLIWSFFPIITFFAYKTLSPIFTYIFVLLFSTLFFGIILGYKGIWHELKNKDALKEMFLGSVFIGVIYYILTFIALKYTTAANVMILGLLEVFATFLIFWAFFNETHKKIHIFGALLMVFGACIVLFPGKFEFNKGDLLILISVFFAPFGNYYQQKARKRISSESILFLRSVITLSFVFIIGLVFYPLPTFNQVKSAFPWLIISGVFLFSIVKLFWIEAINKISVSKAISLTTSTPFFTLIFAYLILGETPTIWQILGLIPLVIGTYLIMFKVENKNIDSLKKIKKK